ncbi:MAG: hypothetical protein CFE34_00080 [Rhodobacteraceae bacterium PARR1]|nr:MAG: hypothetical protein CFE34_00080 [Rhodobacteraceae bacterium PARR1]
MPVVGFFVGSFLGFGLARVFYEVDSAGYFARINGANLTSLILGLFWGLFGIAVLPALFPPDIPRILIFLLVVIGAVGFVCRQNYHRVIVMLPKPGLAAGSELAFNIMIFGALLVVLWMGGSWVDMVTSQTIIFILTAGISAGIVFSLVGTRGFADVDIDWSRRNFFRSAPFVIVGLVSPLMLTIDKFIIASVLGVESMGVYAATSLYLSGMFLLSGVFSKVYVPSVYAALSKFHETADPAFLRRAQKRLRLVLLGLVPLVAVIALVCTFHAYLVLDLRYRPAVDVTWLVVVAGASGFVQVALIPFFDSFNEARQMSVLAFFGLGVSAIGLWVGAAWADIWGAAFGLMVGQLVYVALSLVQYARLGFEPYKRS